MTTMSDVARLADVSPGIVSRLLNEDATLRVREETRQRVLDAAKALNYTPNYAARALRMSKVGVIGLAVHDASNPVYSEIIAGAQAEATQAGYALMLADIDALATDDKLFKRIMASGAIDGLLLQRAGTTSDAFVSKIASGRVPTVLLNDRTRGAIGSVAVDDYAAAFLATSHLTELGHKRIGLLRVNGVQSRSDRRTKGWSDALAQAGLDPSRSPVFMGGNTPEEGRRAMQAMLAERERPTAVFAANVLSAVGALSACREAGVEVPGDVSVVGLHDVSLAEYLSPKLTVVKLPLFELGARAVRALLEQLEHGKARHVTITEPPPAMVIRESASSPG
jgi:LacI family transcriptional regulator